MTAVLKRTAGEPRPPLGQGDHKKVYDTADKAFRLIDQYETPPYPSTYALWYAYVEKSNEALVTEVDGLIGRSGNLSAYEIDEVCKIHLTEKDESAARQSIGREFEQQLAGVMALIQKGVSNSDHFQAALGSIEEDLPASVSPDRIDAIISQLMFENRRMARHSQELNDGLRASQKQIAKLNSELEEVRNQSMRDALTGVANRRAFDLRLATDIKAARTGEGPLCLALADIDHFKRVNDTYGHRVGDEVLKIFASIISNNIKGQDMVARYGGEEFAIILPNTSVEAAAKLIEKVRIQFSKTNLVFKQSRQCLGKITASFGIAAFQPGLDGRDLVEQADQKLYAAKNAGRNMIKADGID